MDVSAAIVLVRHAAPEILPDQPYGRWPLSDQGRAAARRLAREPLWRDLDRIFTSPELKAQETAQIIAGPNGITVTAVEELREADRPHGQWFDDYPAAVAGYLRTPREPVHGWEAAASLLSRFSDHLALLAGVQPLPFAVLGGGLALSIYIASLEARDPYPIWSNLRMPDLALVAPVRRAVLQPFGVWPSAGA